MRSRLPKLPLSMKTFNRYKSALDTITTKLYLAKDIQGLEFPVLSGCYKASAFVVLLLLYNLMHEEMDEKNARKRDSSSDMAKYAKQSIKNIVQNMASMCTESYA